MLAIDREEVSRLLQQAKVIHMQLKIIAKIGKDLSLQSLARQLDLEGLTLQCAFPHELQETLLGHEMHHDCSGTTLRSQVGQTGSCSSLVWKGKFSSSVTLDGSAGSDFPIENGRGTFWEVFSPSLHTQFYHPRGYKIPY